MEQKEKQRKKKEKDLLKSYLNQYYIGRIKRGQLEKRLKNIKAEMNMPIGGINYTPINYQTNNIGLGAASFVYRMSEIETKIEEQKNRIEKALLKIMDMIDFLEESSIERMVLEMRYIDCKHWLAIEKEIHLSRSSLFIYHDKGLERLLTFKKVHQVLKEYEIKVFEAI